jgi:hypothetical protein
MTIKIFRWDGTECSCYLVSQSLDAGKKECGSAEAFVRAREAARVNAFGPYLLASGALRRSPELFHIPQATPEKSASVANVCGNRLA